MDVSPQILVQNIAETAFLLSRADNPTNPDVIRSVHEKEKSKVGKPGSMKQSLRFRDDSPTS